MDGNYSEVQGDEVGRKQGDWEGGGMSPTCPLKILQPRQPYTKMKQPQSKSGRYSKRQVKMGFEARKKVVNRRGKQYEQATKETKRIK